MELSTQLVDETQGPQISDYAFGGRYTAFQDVDRFTRQVDDLDLGLISWPGGYMAESLDDRYGFDFDGLYDPTADRPDLNDMMALAVSEGAALSIVIPTLRYLDGEELIADDIQTFVTRLLDGEFGPLPEKLILQVGSEYYGTFDDQADPAGTYANIANQIIEELSVAISTHGGSAADKEALLIAVQIGKTLDEDETIRTTLSDVAKENTDILVHNRFAYEIQGIDNRISRVEEILENWNQEELDDTIGESRLFLAGWNTVSLTRNIVLDDYEDETGLTLSADEFADRTNVQFERYWQDRLEEPAYGQEHAAYLLEGFASYAELGLFASTPYGFDVQHPLRLSFDDQTGESATFVGAAMLEMIYESVGGTNVIPSANDFSRDDVATLYGFENEDKLVLFVAAGRTSPGLVSVDLSSFVDDPEGMWAMSLTSEVSDDWMTEYGIPDNAQVDETPEGETYATPVQESLDLFYSDDTIAFELTSPYEIARIAIAKTEAGAAEIESWGEFEQPFPALPPVPESSFGVPDQDDDLPIEDLAMVAEAVGGAAAGAAVAALASVFLIF